MHQTRWNSFLKKKRALIPVSMNDAISRIRAFVTPLLTQPSVPVTEWDPNERCWKKTIITPADEKTHGFNRVDDSPQIFNYV